MCVCVCVCFYLFHLSCLAIIILYKLLLYIYIYIYISAVKQLIAINRIHNKGFCLHYICVCTVYIYYVYINTNTCSIYLRKMLCLYSKYIYIRGVTIRVFILNRSVRGFRFGAHYKPNDSLD